MEVFFKCSFKSGMGYRVGQLDLKTGKLKYISESNDSILQSMSKVSARLLKTQLGRSTLLATDENGKYLLGVFGLIQGDYNKYVNMIYTDTNIHNLEKLFSYLCKYYNKSNNKMLDIVQRDDNNADLGYGVDYTALQIFIDNALKELPEISISSTKHNKLIYFVSRDSYDDYRLNIQGVLDDRATICCEYIQDNSYQVDIPASCDTENKKANMTFRIWALIGCIVVLIVGVIMKRLF